MYVRPPTVTLFLLGLGRNGKTMDGRDVVRVAPTGANASTNELDDLARGVPVPLARISPDGTILWANDAALALVGQGPDELLGERLQDLCPDPHGADAVLEALRSGKGTSDQPLRLRGPGGGVRNVLVHLNVRRAADGQVQDARLALRDITDRVAVAAERGRLLDEAVASRESTTATTDGYLHFAPDWTITFARLNAGPERSAAIVGKTLWEVYPDVRGSEFEAHYRAAMADRQPRTFRAYYAPQDLWLENRLYPAGDGLALFYRDVGWHVDLERQLRERSRQQAAVARLGHSALRGTPIQDLLDEALAAIADVLKLDLLGVMEIVPTGFRVIAVHGYPDALRGRVLPASEFPQSSLALEQGKAVVVEDLAHETRFTPSALLLAQGAVSGLTLPLHGPDGPYGILGGHGRKARRFSEDDVNFADSVAHLLSSALQRSRADEELRRHRDDLETLVAQRTAALERAYQEMETFNYAVSHDLRGPVRAIVGFSTLLERQAIGLDAHGRELLDEVKRAADRMGDLIDHLLALSRADRAPASRVTVDLSGLAKEILDAEAARSPARRVRVDIEPGLAVDGDPDLLRIALENLLGNAWKFTVRAPDPCVRFGRRVEDGEAVLCVEDNGAGFDMADAGRLFKPFQRLHRSSEYDGTGIGLTTVRRIIDRHGGRIWATSQPGLGASFFFTLPGLSGPATAAGLPRSPGEAPSG